MKISFLQLAAVSLKQCVDAKLQEQVKMKPFKIMIANKGNSSSLLTDVVYPKAA